MQAFSLLIDGQFVPAADGGTFESINPYDGSPVAQVPAGKSADIDRAVTAARKAFDDGPWPRMTGAERAAVLRQMAEKIEGAAKELTSLVIAESGSTYRKAKGEVFLSGKHMGYFAKLAEKETEQLLSMSREGVSKNLLVREPIGVCGAITPWNFPLQMLIWKIGPALAAGNTLVLKPAEETPGVALRLAQLIAETDLPPGVLNVVTGTGEAAGAPLTKHADVDKLAFTGSTEIGRKIMAEAAPGLKRLTLELGGKSANIVFADADMDQAVDAALYAAFFHSGQCCTAGTRLLLEDAIHDNFVQRLKARTEAMHLGDPADRATDLGPLVSKKQQARVQAYVEAGKRDGATLVLGGATSEELPGGACFITPTLFTGVTPEMTIAQEEIFGPVLAVMRFKDETEALRLANDTPFGLAAAVWSQDEERAMRVARQLRAGTVWVNEYHLISEKAPFGGFKQSGLGRELGEDALAPYTETKHIHVDEIKDRAKKFWYDAVISQPASPTASETAS